MLSEDRLSEEESWGTPLQASPRLLHDLLGRSERGMRLWAPSLVALDARRSLPVHAGVVGDPVEVDRLGLLERTIVVAVDVATGRTQALRVGKSSGRETLAPAPGFEGGLGPTTGVLAAQVARFVLWDTSASAAWRAGHYRLTALAANHASNDVLVELIRSTKTVDPAVRDGHGLEGALQVWPQPDPAGGLPRYDAAGSSVSPPSEPGVVLATERVATVRAGATCPLHGAVRAARRDVYRARHGAVIPVTLVITGTETAGPLVVPLCIPSFDRDDGSGDTGLTARFAVDLFRLAELTASPQTYLVYAFTADGHTGPHPIAVVAD